MTVCNGCRVFGRDGRCTEPSCERYGKEATQ